MTVIAIRGELGETLVQLQQEAAEARRRAAEAERAFATAKVEVPTLDALVARLEGEERAGLKRGKEVKQAVSQLEDARERSSEAAQRRVLVARAEANARAAKVSTFAAENEGELLSALYEQAAEVVQQTTEHLSTAAALRTTYNEAYGSSMELLRVLGRNSAELPSADGALSFYRELARFAENGIPVPAVPASRTHLTAA